MIKKKENVERQSAANVGNFDGEVIKNLVLTSAEMGGRLKGFNRIDLPVGSMIKEHAHVDDAEIYYILEGEVTVTDNDATHILHAGDVVFTADGNRHSIKNTGKTPAAFVAVIF